MVTDMPYDPPDDGRRDPRSPSSGHIKTRTATEALVATVWSEVLQLDQVAVTDNFFEVGGHSIAAVRVVHELGARSGVELDLETFFDLDTLEQIAAEIDRRQAVCHGQAGSQFFEGEL